MSGTASDAAYYRQLASFIHTYNAGSSVWLNPGQYPDQSYMSIGDVVMVFEGTYAQYLGLQVPGWAGSYPASKFAHTVYATPAFRFVPGARAGRQPPRRARLRDQRDREQPLRRPAELLLGRDLHRVGRLPELMNSRPLRVATLITRLEGGAGVLALRGATALDPGRFRVTIVAGSGNHLLDEAAAAGLEVISEPALRMPIDPRSDLRALRALTGLLRRGRFDVAHTHTAKAGTLGRLAARHAGVPRIVHTYHGFPFHEFQSRGRRGAYVAIERRLGRITDVALCVGTGVSVEAIRRGLIAPDRIRTIGVAVETMVPSARTPGARERARRALGLPAGATVVGAVGRAAPTRRRPRTSWPPCAS